MTHHSPFLPGHDAEANARRDSVAATERVRSRYLMGILLFLFAVFALTCLGVGMLAVAGAKSSPDLEKSLLIHTKQTLWWLPVAVLCGIAATLVPLDLRKRFKGINREKILRWGIWLSFGGSCVALAALFVPGIGTTSHGSTRWFQIPGQDITLQISDFAKATFVLAFALLLSDATRHMRLEGIRERAAPNPSGGGNSKDSRSRAPRPASWLVRMDMWLRAPRRFYALRRKRGRPWFVPPSSNARAFYAGFLAPCAVILVPCVLIGMEMDLGTLALFAMVGVTLLVVNGVQWRFFCPALLSVVALFCFIVSGKPSRFGRVIAFIDPQGTSSGVGSQLYQGMVALGTGGIKGVGLGDALQQRGYLAEAHTDFVFAIVGESMGILGTIGILVAFLVIFLTVFFSLGSAHNVFQFNVCLGSMLFLVLQALVNMYVVTSLFPTTGMALPFVSYGGSSLVTSFILVGLILNCLWRWRRRQETDVADADSEFHDAPDFTRLPASLTVGGGRAEGKGRAGVTAVFPPATQTPSSPQQTPTPAASPPSPSFQPVPPPPSAPPPDVEFSTPPLSSSAAFPPPPAASEQPATHDTEARP